MGIAFGPPFAKKLLGRLTMFPPRLSIARAVQGLEAITIKRVSSTMVTIFLRCWFFKDQKNNAKAHH